MEKKKFICFILITTLAIGCNNSAKNEDTRSNSTPNETHANDSYNETRVIINNDGWELVGDLNLPISETPLPVVLMLNRAAGNRHAYAELAAHLADRNIASLRLDLRGHGESTNLDEFIPGEVPRSPMIWDSEQDVIAVMSYLKNHSALDSTAIGLVGGSYSGEEMAEAGRLSGFAKAYVELSPGSLSDESIASMDESGAAWLFVSSNNERHLKEVTQLMHERTQTVEILSVAGTYHASRILEHHPDMAERIAVWLYHKLK